MRGTVSRTLVLDDVFVPEDEALMPPGVYYQAAIRWPHNVSNLDADLCRHCASRRGFYRAVSARRSPWSKRRQAP